MDDAGCTYDFRELLPLYDAWKDGAEFVVGSRFKGIIDCNAVLRLHRYFGTPVRAFRARPASTPIRTDRNAVRHLRPRWRAWFG